MILKLKNKIALLIALGNTLILVLLIALGLLMVHSMEHLASFTADLYAHPFTVNNAALMAQSRLERMRTHMLEIALSRDAGRIEQLSAKIAALDSSARNSLRTAEASFLGDRERIREVHRLLGEWQDLRTGVIALARRGQTQEAEHLATTAGSEIFARLNAELDYVVGFTRNKATSYVETANREAGFEILRMEWLLGSFASVIFLVGLEMARRTSRLMRTEESANEAVRTSERRYRLLFENMPDGYVHGRMIYEDGKPRDFECLDANEAFGRQTGLEKFCGSNISELIPGINDSSPDLFEALGRIAMDSKPEKFETYIRVLDKWFSISAFSTEHGHFVAIFDDITKRKNYEKQWRLAESLYYASSEAMLITDSDINIVSVNPAFTRITGYTPEEVLGRTPARFCSGHHDQAFIDEIRQSIEATSHWEGEAWDMKKSGEVFAVHLSISAIPDDTGTGRRYSAQFSDITEKKRMDEIVARHANFDSLTGLPNRRLFRDRLEQEIKKAHRTRNNLALMFIDLDHFKEVNDILGHQVGDKLLVEAARRIVSCVRESDTVSRLGGDEFTVILSEVTDVNRIKNVAHAIVQSLSQPYQLVKEGLFISASVGITVYPGDATSPDDLLRNADQAMYLSKSEGRNRYHFFTEEMQEATRKHHQLAQDLHGALREKQFVLHFQPIVDINTGKLFKAEALLRWHHPVRGMIAPSEFIPVAEEIGLIDEIGDWVFGEALERGNRWAALLGHGFRIGVNISPQQLMSREHSIWISHVHEMKLSAKNVSVELTESTLLSDRPEVTDSLFAIHDAGMEVGIDDFGTGYSSLSYLQKFRIDYLKIDQSFVRSLAPGSTELALSESIIVMAHKLGMQVVAEGIETAEQRDLLALAGCDFGQGYFYSPPVAAEEFEQLLGKGFLPARPELIAQQT